MTAFSVLIFGLLSSACCASPVEIQDLVSEARENHSIPGISISLTHGDQYSVAQGFGLAETETAVPVSAHTPFYLASTGKLFTALAAAALATSSDLDLHTDINRYLSPPLVDTERPPVTLHHLLTHTSGLEDRLIGYQAPVAEDRLSLDAYLRDKLPARSRNPGAVMAYSNYGYALAGRVIESVTGRDFDQFVSDRILTPLSMSQSGYLPLQPEVEPRLAQGYSWNGTQRQLGFSHAVPAGGIVSSAADMLVLMQAILSLESPVITSPMASLLMSRQAELHPAVPGRGYAFWQMKLGKSDAWVISGAAYGYSSALLLIPERNFGVTVMQNRQEPGVAMNLAKKIANTILDIDEPLPDPALPYANIDRLAGTWGSVRWSASTVEKIGKHFGEIELEAVSDETLHLISGRRKLAFQHIGNGVFSQEKNPEVRLAFNASPGQADRMYSNHFGSMPMTYERVPPFTSGKSRTFQIAFVFTVLTGALLWYSGAAIVGYRKRRKISPLVTSGLSVTLAALVFFFLLVMALRNFAEVMSLGANAWLRAATLWPLVIVGFFVLFLINLRKTWSDLGIWARLGNGWVLVALVALLYLTFEYRWIGWQF